MITPIDHGLEDPTLYFSPEQILFVTDSLVYIYRRENIYRGLVGGSEIKMLWDIYPGYTFEGSFTGTHNKNKDTGKSLSYYPDNSLYLNLKANNTLRKVWQSMEMWV